MTAPRAPYLVTWKRMSLPASMRRPVAASTQLSGELSSIANDDGSWSDGIDALNSPYTSRPTWSAPTFLTVPAVLHS